MNHSGVPSGRATCSGLVASIRRFATHDGPGIRTTVFLKGCPLRCLWCQNPETMAPKPELMLNEKLCTLCGGCRQVCEHGGHELSNGSHQVDFDRCVRCGRCVDVCPQQALEIAGRRMTVADTLAILLKDRRYYSESGGGVTLSGGEPLLQPEFALALLRACTDEGIHTAIDTSGYATPEVFDRFIEAAPLFLFDLKAVDEERHRRLTGAGNRPILRNLREAVRRRADVLIRIPLVPGCNDDEQELERMALLVARLRPVPPVELLAYHGYARHKYRALGKTCPMPEDAHALSRERLAAARRIFAGCGVEVVGESSRS